MFCTTVAPSPCCFSNVEDANEYVTVPAHSHTHSPVDIVQSSEKDSRLEISLQKSEGGGSGKLELPWQDISSNTCSNCSLEEWVRKEVGLQLSRIDKKVDLILERAASHQKRASVIPGIANGKLHLEDIKEESREPFDDGTNSQATSFDYPSAGEVRYSPRSPPSSMPSPPAFYPPALNLRSSAMTESGRKHESSRSRASASSAPSSKVSSDRKRHSGYSVQQAIENMDRIRKTVDARRSDRIAGRLFQSKIWLFTEKPYSSFAAYCYSIFVPLFVASGVCISFMQTVDGSPLKGTNGELLQTVYEVAFALELIVRFAVCPDKNDFLTNVFNHIDFMSALPVLVRIAGYISELSGNGGLPDDVVRGMSVVPLLRLLRLTRRFETFQLLLRAFRLALEALPVLLYILLLIALIFSALIYFVEPEANIESLPKALWLTIVTMTTVGYGDVTPESLGGHIVVAILIIISALYMAIPIGIVGHAFSQVWGDRDRLLLLHRIRDAFLEGGFNSQAIADIFQLFDTNESGELDIEEFEHMLRTMQINISDERVNALFHALDLDQRGTISQGELLENLFPTSALFAALQDSSGSQNCRRPGSM